MTSTALRVVYAADPAYAPHLAASARSLVANHLGPVEILVLSCGLDRDAKDGILNHVVGTGPVADRCALDFVEISGLDLDAYSIENSQPLVNHVSSATYARLLLDRVGPSTGRLLYLDADTIVLSSLDELWHTNLGGHALGAIDDPRIPTLGHRYGVQRRRLLKCKRRAKYFNAGVLLLDMDVMRSQNVFENARWYLREVDDDVMFFDQEALNAAIGGRYQSLSSLWNVMTSDLDLARLQPNARIRHYSSRYKPWDYPDHDADAHHYFRYAESSVRATASL